MDVILQQSQSLVLSKKQNDFLPVRMISRLRKLLTRNFTVDSLHTTDRLFVVLQSPRSKNVILRMSAALRMSYGSARRLVPTQHMVIT